ncbi:O-antigen ligase family protein [Stutzerimonas stutzeri]|uniref:O-antigen ligase family protein n=1 Tax=Stutzerimonas stutzeri TaxID=316 RepID=UPI003C6F86EC
MFFIYYIIALVVQIAPLDPYLLVYGFDNPRFLGQFQVLLIPVLLGLFIKHRSCRLLSIALFTILTLHWCIAWSIAGRGVLLATSMSCFSLIILNRNSFTRTVVTHAAAMLSGLFLFLVAFILIPALLDISQRTYESLRLGLSSRDSIWLLSWNIMATHPWLGAGPLHFAAERNNIAAHPHQIVLQLLAEWGIPATISAILVIFYGLKKASLSVKSRPEPMDAALWAALSGGILLAQVDGVLVTPYSQGWLAILCGIAISRWTESNGRNSLMKFFISLLLLPTLLVCGNVVIHLVGLEEFSQSHKQSSPPRYWGSGWIP